MDNYGYIKKAYLKSQKMLQGTYGDSFRPNLHIYVDTSGSGCPEQYENPVKAAIRVAKATTGQIAVNMFSHALGQEQKIMLHGMSVEDAYKAFSKIPTMPGGTDYAQVWDYIGQDASRQNEVSIIITDFGWIPLPGINMAADGRQIGHPSNLYYLPFCDIEDGGIFTASFIKHMKPICPNIDGRILQDSKPCENS